MELPNVPLSSVKVPHTNKHVSDLSQSIQQQYTDEHKAQLKNELQKVIKKGYVYLDEGDNSISIHHTEGYKKIKLSDLDKEQNAQVLSIAQKEATKKTKEKIFKK